MSFQSCGLACCAWLSSGPGVQGEEQYLLLMSGTAVKQEDVKIPKKIPHEGLEEILVLHFHQMVTS